MKMNEKSKEVMEKILELFNELDVYVSEIDNYDSHEKCLRSSYQIVGRDNVHIPIEELL